MCGVPAWLAEGLSGGREELLFQVGFQLGMRERPDRARCPEEKCGVLGVTGAGGVGGQAVETLDGDPVDGVFATESKLFSNSARARSKSDVKSACSPRLQ